MKITILCVGKIKEKYFTDAIGEYTKRLSKYASVTIREMPDEKTPDGASEAVERKIRETEGERLLKFLNETDHFVQKIALCIDGAQMSSEKLAETIEQYTVSGKSHIVFVIGGSLGLDPRVIAACDERLSFSKMTFPHQLMRVILLEQIYRSFRILRGEPYHK